MNEKIKISDEDIFDTFKKNDGNFRQTTLETGVSYPKMKRILLEKGLFVQKFNTGGRRRKINFNDDFFEEINTKEKAYWLGFIWGDGFITNNSSVVGISLSVVDKNHLEKFSRAIGYDGSIRVYNILSGYKTHNEDGTPNQYCRIILNSKKMVSDLKNHGLQENKSLIMTPPHENVVPNDMMNHFIRGIFDANGSINISKNKTNGKETLYFHFLGTIPIIEMFLKYSKYITSQKLYQRKKDCPIYNIRITVNKKSISVLDYIYTDSYEDICLNRKYDRYKDFCKRVYKK